VPLRVVVEADGGSRGNPGPAGYGALVRDASTGELLREVAAGIGVASNNVAEYRGLIAGLQAALDLGADEVEVRMDSLLVVNQMSGLWKVKHQAMRPLATEAAALVRKLGRVSFGHIPRELNKHADRLANEAMDAAATGREWRVDVTAAPALHVSAPTQAAAPILSATTGSPATNLSAAAGSAEPAARWVPGAASLRALLLRHGETALSPERRFSGRGDPELSDRGRAQAVAAAARIAREHPQVGVVVTSPLRRAADTGRAVADAVGARVVTDDELVETDFGDWEGRTWAEVRDGWPDLLAAWSRDVTVAPPGGESFASVYARVGRARERLVATYEGATLVVVSHVTPIKVLLCEALAAPASALFRVHLDVASLSRVDWSGDGTGAVKLVNDTGHLGADLLTVPR
jgi:ribonuclease H / adenosylcobalamin/alpha-ribazole phosphatase